MTLESRQETVLPIRDLQLKDLHMSLGSSRPASERKPAIKVPGESKQLLGEPDRCRET